MNFLENKTLLIIGLGLIGGSIARGLSAAVPGLRILAHGRDELALQSALIDGSIHACSTDLLTMAPQADIIMLCTPTLTVRTILQQLTGLIAEDVIITDAASVKGNVVSDARRFFGTSLHRFVPGHPIAGSEQSGYKASRADLFNNRKVILTPLAENSAVAVRTVMQLWQLLGADVHGMTPERHDEVLAGTSHLPHLLAYTLVNTLVDSVGEQDRAQQVFDYAAGGFADFSRIASSDPHMWRDIFLANRNATVDVLDAYIASLGNMRQRLLQGDGDGLQNEFSRAKRVRDEFIRRFKPSGVAADTNTSGFTVEPEQLSVRPGSSLHGVYRLPADLSTALAALELSASAAGVTRIEGFPENLTALTAVQGRRISGLPVVGPEQGIVWVYGPDDAPASVMSLPADAFLTGLLILGATVLPGSTVQLQAVPQLYSADSVLGHLQHLGAQLEFIETDNSSAELLCNAATLTGAQFDLSASSLPDEQLMVILAAATLAQGVSHIHLGAERAHRLIAAGHGIFGWAAQLDLNDDVLTVTPQLQGSTELDLGGSVVASLVAVVMAQKGSGQLIIHHPGEIAEAYPGLLLLLAEMGFGLEQGLI